MWFSSVILPPTDNINTIIPECGLVISILDEFGWLLENDSGCLISVIYFGIVFQMRMARG